jgi:transcription elongation factor GreA
MSENAQSGSAPGDAGEMIKRKLQEKIAQLDYEMNVELPKEIGKAREHGDLKENAEYKYAKERQLYVAMQLQGLRQRLSALSLVNLSKIPRGKVGYGSEVTVRDLDKDEEMQYRLVTAEESDAAQGLISTTSPIGRAFIGKKEGDIVNVRTPAGAREFEILRLKTIYDE